MRIKRQKEVRWLSCRECFPSKGKNFLHKNSLMYFENSNVFPSLFCQESFITGASSNFEPYKRERSSSRTKAEAPSKGLAETWVIDPIYVAGCLNLVFIITILKKLDLQWTRTLKNCLKPETTTGWRGIKKENSSCRAAGFRKHISAEEEKEVRNLPGLFEPKSKGEEGTNIWGMRYFKIPKIIEFITGGVCRITARIITSSRIINEFFGSPKGTPAFTADHLRPHFLQHSICGNT